MTLEKTSDLTRILHSLSEGESGAAEELLVIVYDELRVIARRVFQSQNASDRTVQPTILVHDVFMKLTGNSDVKWEGRVHFFAVAAKAIRDLLVDDVRRQQAKKRGGGWNRVTLSAINDPQNESMIDLIDLEDALARLKEISPRQERIVELRFFGGLSVEEVAAVLNISDRTVMYDWRMARAWLRKTLENNAE